LNDGRNDRQSGHSFRATQDSNYKHADRGYSSGLGARQQEAREKAEKARRAASSVTGSPASQTPRRATGSLRDELEAAAEDLAA